MRQEYETTAVIHASADAVWKILTDAARYRDWNSEILAVDGVFTAGRIKVHVRLGDGTVRKLPQKVSLLDASRRMEWVGGLPFGLFVGRRTFTVAPRDGGAEFHMHIRMSGPLAPLILKSVGDRQPEIDRFSADLKRRAETMA